MSITGLSIDKPEYVFDRDDEWEALRRFVSSQGGAARLGLVYGRRRQGKTLLLEALCERCDGFMWQARQQSAVQNLADLEAALSRRLGVPLRLGSWDDAIATLLELRSRREGLDTVPVVLDETGYLLDADPAFASRLQAALSPAANRARAGGVRLILCGSAFGQMRSLIEAGAPLRGRAQLDLVLRPFRFREAARYWGLSSNPDAAFRLHALVGGTPAYREFVGGIGPRRGDVDQWVAEHVLASSSPLLREGRVSVLEDPSLNDRALYWAVLGAIASGATGRGDITRALGRPATSLHHALDVLIAAGWITIERNPLRTRGQRFVIDEPIVRLHHLVIEPADGRLARPGFAPQVWDDAQPLVRARIYGPHFERLAREWALLDAAEDVVGGRVTAVGPGSIAMSDGRLDLDLIALDSTPPGRTHVCAVGEAKSGQQRVGLAQLDRLDAAVARLPEADATTKRLLFGRSGFTRELQSHARRRSEVELVDLARLYS